MLNDFTRYNHLAARITSIAEEATTLNTILGSELVDFIISSGVDRKIIDEEADRLKESWGY